MDLIFWKGKELSELSTFTYGLIQLLHLWVNLHKILTLVSTKEMNLCLFTQENAQLQMLLAFSMKLWRGSIVSLVNLSTVTIYDLYIQKRLIVLSIN